MTDEDDRAIIHDMAEAKVPPRVTKTDIAREREVYRYFQPDEFPDIADSGQASKDAAVSDGNTISVDVKTSPDTTLTAFTQLCALRLNAQRAMISVIDQEKQYFIAESTKTLNLADTTRHEAEGDGLWAGCATVDKEGRLCEHTISLPADIHGIHIFTVPDLTQDPRFAQLPFVAGPPFFKFYAGTPLTTKRGINIGSLFILDDVVRPPLNTEQEAIMGTIAKTAMKHMELAAESDDRKRIMRLSMGLNDFVEGRRRLVVEHAAAGFAKRWADSGPRSNSNSRKSSIRSATHQNHLHEQTGLAPLADDGSSPAPAYDRTVLDKENSYSDSDISVAKHGNEDGDHKSTLQRAANILSDSLETTNHGGVVFFDATARRRYASAEQHRSEPGTPGVTTEMDRPAEILAASHAERPWKHAVELRADAAFTPMDEENLRNLLRRYPRGKLWTFAGDMAVSSSDDEALVTDTQRQQYKSAQNHGQRRDAETAMLRDHFPGVRQLLFYGLWDAGSSRWFTGGFAWTTSNRHIFTAETELNFFMAFGNSIMAQISRLASMAADRQKADFIGSISHELRSPLHGILASTEFLMETNHDSFQSSLVETISSCGRTLLDTINHILDYSKINAFERTWRRNKKPPVRMKSARVAHGNLSKEAPPMLNIFAETNIASITEEVVEGVFAGQMYQDISSTEVAGFSSSARIPLESQDGNHNSKPRRIAAVKDVEVILNIAHRNYVFIAQPGALKRVVMNVFGNALKYTQKGHIIVTVYLEQPGEDFEGDPIVLDDPSTQNILRIRVTDTGKGISKTYLRTSLFNPFCQEDVLASGTGLGLSIVRSIITMLRGTVSVQSELGVGTEVTMRIPLSRVPGFETPVSTPSTNADSNESDLIAALLADYAGTSVTILDSNDDHLGIKHSLKSYLEDWFGFGTSIERPGSALNADLIVVDEQDLSILMQQNRANIPAIVLCNAASRTQTASIQASAIITEFVTKPLGPYKLAKAVRSCLDRVHLTRSGLSNTEQLSLPDIRGSARAENEVTPMPNMKNLTIETGNHSTPIEVHTNSQVTACDSKNAHMALGDVSSSPRDNPIADSAPEEFPFPSLETPSDTSQRCGAISSSTKTDSTEKPTRPELRSRTTEPITRRLAAPVASVHMHKFPANFEAYDPPDDLAAAKALLRQEGQHLQLTASNLKRLNGHSANEVHAKPIKKPPKLIDTTKKGPRLLLVDDNKINLRLLQTCMKKRKYHVIDLAEDGQMAVEAAESNEEGYDIIFMDISMPIMNGFEATRAIRDLEAAREFECQKDNSINSRPPALVIALTGLASSRDQAEAFTSGVDLFLTKPVSFKEVGKLLDNWEAHGGLRNASDATP